MNHERHGLALPTPSWGLCATLLCLGLALYAGEVRAAAAAPPSTLPTLTLSGKIVKAELSGFEPDFDPIDRVTIAATLHDPRPAPQALPDTMLVLSTYLENFQPDTTPVLPDLLHPNQKATALGGWMQGKAALVNQGGATGYRGSMLGEVFLDNAAHLVLDIERSGAPDSAPSLRLKGALTLRKDLSVRGTVRPERPLLSAEVGVFRVPRGRQPSWQTVVSGLSIHLPSMMGTAGSGRKPANPRSVVGSSRAPSTPTMQSGPIVPVRTLLWGAALGALIMAGLFWHHSVKTSRTEGSVVP